MKKDIVYSGLDLNLLNEQIRLNHLELVSKQQDWHTLVAIQYAKDNNLPLNEGIYDKLKSAWQNAKYQFGKLGSIEKGGKIIGRGEATKQLTAEREAAIEKLAKSTISTAFMSKFKQTYPEFPNMKTQEEFVKATTEMAALYDSIKKAVEDKKLDASEANGLIASLRSLVKVTLDRDLSDVYKHFNESLIKEQENTDYAKESETMKGLSSNTLPKVLAALGALGVGFGWLVKQSWFLSLFRSARTASSIVRVITTGNKLGVTEHLATLMGRPGTNISGMKVSDFIANMKSHSTGLLDSAGNPTTNFINMARDAGNPNFATWWATNIAAPANATKTLGQAIPLSGAGAPGAGGDIFTSTVTRAVTPIIGGGTLSAAGASIAALSPVLTTLGIGAFTAGAAVYLIRQKGLKSSRAQLLADLMNTMQDVKGGGKSSEQQPTTQGGEAGGGDKEVVYVYRKGGPDNTSLTNILNGLDLPNWAIKDLTSRVKKELEANNFVVKEALLNEKRLTFGKNEIFDQKREVIELGKELKNGEVKRFMRQGSIYKKYGIKNFLLSKNKNGIIRAYDLQSRDEADNWAGSGTDTEQPPTDGTTTGTGGQQSEEDKSAKDSLVKVVMEFASDTTVTSKKGGKFAITKFSRSDILKDPRKFIQALSSEEKLLLVRLPDNPNLEYSKFDFFTMDTEERQDLYRKVKQGQIFLGRDEKADTGRDKEASRKGKKEKGQGREYQLQGKMAAPQAGTFKVSDLRNILRTGHTVPQQDGVDALGRPLPKRRPIPDDQIRSAQKAVTQYLKPYLDKAGVKLRESQLHNISVGFIDYANRYLIEMSKKNQLLESSQVARWKKLAGIIRD